MTCIALVGAEDKNPCGLSPTVGETRLCKDCLQLKVLDLSSQIHSLRQRLATAEEELRRTAELSLLRPNPVDSRD